MGIEQTPTDELTNLPLLVVPNEAVLDLMDDPIENAASRERGEDFVDWNHLYHPRKEALLQGLGGQAVRDSRGQLLLRSEHSEYHFQYSGPELPVTSEQRFQAVVLSAAGYVPPRAIDLSGTSPRTVDLTSEQRTRLQTSGEVRMISQESVRKFLAHHVISQEVDHIDESVVDEFMSLNPANHEGHGFRQRYLANLLLSLLVERAAEPVDTSYTLGRQQQFMRSGMPANPRDFVHRQIVGPTQGRTQSKRLVNMVRGRFALEQGSRAELATDAA